jgi:hypothetical protein
MARALHMGDELHSRNTAATLMFVAEIVSAFISMGTEAEERVQRTLAFFRTSDYSFLRLSMAAAKATANAARNIEGSSVVVALSLSCRDLALQVSGLGDKWFRGPHPEVQAKLFEGFTDADIDWIGGESCHAELIGLGGFAQAAAFGLQAYQGGSAQAMANMNLEMYRITVGEHTDFKIPFFNYRGTPIGIDIFKVIETRIKPVIDGGLAGRNGGQIGAGILRVPVETFEKAARAHRNRFARGAGVQTGPGDA